MYVGTPNSNILNQLCEQFIYNSTFKKIALIDDVAKQNYTAVCVLKIGV